MHLKLGALHLVLSVTNISCVRLQDGARCYGEYRRWKPRYEELKDQVKFAEKNVDEERKAVLRRYRL